MWAYRAVPAPLLRALTLMRKHLYVDLIALSLWSRASYTITISSRLPTATLQRSSCLIPLSSSNHHTTIDPHKDRPSRAEPEFHPLWVADRLLHTRAATINTGQLQHMWSCCARGSYDVRRQRARFAGAVACESKSGFHFLKLERLQNFEQTFDRRHI